MYHFLHSIRINSSLLLIAPFFICTQALYSEEIANQFAETESITSENSVENDFYDALARGQASEAQVLLERILGTPKAASEVNAPQLILALANFLCDSGDLKTAEQWYERLDSNFGKQIADEESQKTFHDIISAKLEWLKKGGKRPWAHADLMELCRSIMNSLSKGDSKTLATLLAGIDVYVGWWQSELEPTAREDLLSFIEKHRNPNITWTNEASVASKALSIDESVVYMNTHGWTHIEGGFTNVQFAIHRIPDGWEWRGIVFGESEDELQ